MSVDIYLSLYINLETQKRLDGSHHQDAVYVLRAVNLLQKAVSEVS